MQMTQRSILLLVLILLLCFATQALYKEKEELVLSDWENIQTERFLNRLCRNGACSFEEYVRFYGALSISKQTLEIRIEEYKREQNLENKAYYSLISWEEIREIIKTDGNYRFADESIILIEVQQTGRGAQKRNKRFGWVAEE